VVGANARSESNEIIINMERVPLTDWIKHHRILLLLSIILIISIFLRFYDLGTESIWLDEAASIKESSLTLQGIADHTNQPPLYFLLLRVWISLFGTSEIALRSLSAIFGIFAVLIIYLVGKSLFNDRVGLIGAFLSSFAFFPIHYSQDARAYSLLLLLSLLSYWFFIKLIKKDYYLNYLAYFISSILLAYTHFYGLFIIASQFIFFLVFFKKYKAQGWKYLTTILALIIALIPFVLLLKHKITVIAGTGFWIPKPDFSTLLDTLVIFSSFGSTRYVVFIIFILLAISGIFIIKQSGRKLARGQLKKHKDKLEQQTQLGSSETIAMLILWLFTPILIPFIESQFMTPIYQSKYAVGAFPAFSILVANGLSRIKWRWGFYSILILIVILSSIGLQTYYKYPVKEQWREVAQLIDSNSKSDDIILVSEGYYLSPFNYYYKGNLREVGINNLEDAQQFVRSENEIASDKQTRFWLVLAYNKRQILNYFVNTYGKDSVEIAQIYGGKITVVRFSPTSSSK